MIAVQFILRKTQVKKEQHSLFCSAITVYLEIRKFHVDFCINVDTVNINLSTCNTDAPQCRNCNPASAESMPPIPMIANPGSFLAIAETACNPTGLIALPDTPPYVLSFSRPTAGHGVASALNPISPDTVLIAATPLAPPEPRTCLQLYESYLHQKLSSNMGGGGDQITQRFIKSFKDFTPKATERFF